MVLVACVAFWRGIQLHTGREAFTAYGLGALALALGMWHLIRKPAPRRM
jgi:hypothetical protein